MLKAFKTTTINQLAHDNGTNALSLSLNKPQQTHPKTPQDSSQIKICLATL
jgi:hypothetical protein